MATKSKGYSAEDIEILEDLAPILHRPGMYTDPANPNHALVEVIDNEGYASGSEPDVGRESWMHVEIDREPVPETLAEIDRRLCSLLGDVREAGEDLERGSIALARGRIVRLAQLGLVASQGIGEVAVFRPLRVAFFSTGDELKSVGRTLGAGEIYDSHRYTLYGMLTRSSPPVYLAPIARNNRTPRKVQTLRRGRQLPGSLLERRRKRNP
jgi:hypothetical protein